MDNQIKIIQKINLKGNLIRIRFLIKPLIYREQNINSKLVELIKLIARKAAEEDFKTL